jgi:hypothetical protein
LSKNARKAVRSEWLALVRNFRKEFDARCRAFEFRHSSETRRGMSSLVICEGNESLEMRASFDAEIELGKEFQK